LGQSGPGELSIELFLLVLPLKSKEWLAWFCLGEAEEGIFQI
jgi:hypothetical protein